LDSYNRDRVNRPNDSGFWEWSDHKKIWVEANYEQDVIVKDASLILVAGYPRSGTTFLTFAVKKMYQDASHNIFPKHITEFIRLNLKNDICVTIRNPLEAIGSWNHLSKQLEINTELGLDADFNYYLRYYNFVDKYLDQIALMDFAKFSTDSTYITDKVYKKFNREPVVNMDAELLKKNMMDNGGRNYLPRVPSTTRQQIEDEVLEHPLYKEVLDLHDYLISKEDIHP